MPEPEDIQTVEGAADLITGLPGEDTPGAAGQTPANEENAEVAAFKAKALDEVAKRQAIEEDNRRLNEQILAMANPPQTPQAPKDVFDGIEGYENVTVDQVRQSQAENRQNQAEQTQQLLMGLQYQNFTNANPDYSEIVGTVGPTGRLECAKPLKELMKDIPAMRGLAKVLAVNPAAAPYAYAMVKQHKELKELQAQQTANTEHQAQVNVDNTLAPLSPAAVGGGGSVQGAPSEKQVNEAFDRALAGDFG